MSLYFVCIGITISIINPVFSQNYNLITDTDLYWPAPKLDKPRYLQTVTDPTFGTKITRITGDPGTIIDNSGGTWQNIARHGYSKRPVWNADESLMILEKNSGSTGLLFLDGNTYSVLFTYQVPGNDRRWHPVDPDIMIAVTDTSVTRVNVRTKNVTTLLHFSGYRNVRFGPGEGNLSFNGSHAAVSAIRSSDNKSVGFAIDIGRKIKYPDIDISAIKLDWVSISPLGTYVVINGNFISGDQTQIYDLNGAKIGELWGEYGRPSHYDLTTDDNGDEVAVGVSKSDPDNGRVIKRRLSDGMVTVLTPGGWASHTSTRCINRPGWVISSTSPSERWPPYLGEVIAVKLDGSRVERICHIRGVYKTYNNEAHPSPSPSGSRVIYASDWGSGSEPIQAYVVDFRDKLITQKNKDNKNVYAHGLFNCRE